MLEPQRILIIKLSSLGDIVHSLPALASLRRLFPAAYIAWVVDERNYRLIEGNPYLDEVITFKRQKFKSLIKKGKILPALNLLRNLRRELKERGFDLCIDLQGLAFSSLIALLSSSTTRLGWPFMREGSGLVSKSVPSASKKLHSVDKALKVVEYLGGKTCEKDFTLSIPAKAKEFAKEFLAKHRVESDDLLVGIIPEASIPQKKWPGERFIGLIKELLLRGRIKVVLFGLDLGLADKILKAVSNDKLPIATSKTGLKELMALIEKCHLFIGGDTGATHIASGLNLPVIGLYGPNDPGLTGPYSKKATIIYKNFPCSPCGTRPSCKDNQCMKLITQDEVLKAVWFITSRIGQS